MKVVRILFWASFAALYVVVFGFLNQRVREACTAAACTHGWYSKFNYVEKAQAVGWLVLAPVAAAGVYWLCFVHLPGRLRLRRAHQHFTVVK